MYFIFELQKDTYKTSKEFLEKRVQAVKVPTRIASIFEPFPVQIVVRGKPRREKIMQV